jgi:modulator of FtsH protease
MNSYSPADWGSFFVAIVSAAAALTGLLFVAVSINLQSILKYGAILPSRAAETLASLLFVMISAALTLVPQNTRLLGLEILVFALSLLAITVSTQIRHLRQNPYSPVYWSISRMVASGAATVPGTLAGISLAAHWGGGFYWLVPTAVGGIAGAAWSAWVLLVEIIR